MRTLLGFSAVAALLLAGCADSSAQPAGPVQTSATVSAGAPSVLPLEASTSTDRGEGRTALPEVEVREAELPAPREVEPPVRLVYEAIGADMPVDQVGVAEDGQMEIPEDALRAGWYRFGAAPSDSEGTVVISAHAGSYITPRGPLYDLRSSEVGHRVQVEQADGSTAIYEVTQVEQLGKVTIDFNQYFVLDGEKSLVLITCGGRWDEAAQSYDDNIIVTATLVEG